MRFLMLVAICASTSGCMTSFANNECAKAGYAAGSASHDDCVSRVKAENKQQGQNDLAGLFLVTGVAAGAAAAAPAQVQLVAPSGASSAPPKPVVCRPDLPMGNQAPAYRCQ